tara:strand:- start:104 stop:235 length:132 start_codon:yes stop_codon:yes gene_type:complete
MSKVKNRKKGGEPSKKPVKSTLEQQSRNDLKIIITLDRLLRRK